MRARRPSFSPFTAACAVAVIFVLASLPAHDVRADESDPPAETAEATRLGFGFSLGYAHGFQNVRHPDDADVTQVRMLVMSGQVYYELNAWGRPGTWGDSALDFVFEPQLIVNFAPTTGVAGAATAGFRYRFRRSGTWQPHLIGVAGVGGTDFDLVNQDDGFQFWLEGGVGLRRPIDDRMALAFEVRFHHISNAGTHPPNLGIDSVLLTAGLEF